MSPQRSSPRSQPRSPLNTSDDRAASEVVGSLLLAGMTVAFTVVFGQSMLGAVPEPNPPPASYEFSLSEGAEGWASGDETLHLHHTGGAGLPQSEATIQVTVGAEQHTFAGNDPGGPFADGRLSIGELWSTELTVPASTHVDVQLVQDRPSSTVVAESAFHTPAQACEIDDEAPTVAAWTQEPDPLVTSTSGPVEITATLEDACSGVDRDVDPHLEHRFGDAAFTDAGAADRIGQRTWQATIPEPADGWDAHAGETLSYRLDPLTDHAGNAGPSENRSTPVEVEEAEGELTYVTDHAVFSGSLEDFPAAQNASDDGDAALLTEQSTSAGNTRSEAYGNAHSSSGAEDPGDATGSPDDAYARLAEDDEWVAVEGFQTFSGDIENVELAFQAKDEGSGTDDELTISYKVGNRGGKTTESYDPSQIDATTDDATVYVNVTDDRDWTWTDVEDLQVRAAYDRQGQLDDLAYDVDALWIRVTYEDPAYNMSIRGDIEELPGGDHALELRYAVSDEPHHVQVWNATAEAWEERGSTLTSSSLRSWSVDLSVDEVEANETRFRIVDDGADAEEQSTVWLDYARGRTR